MTKKALISGISGQDGSYLAEHLLQQGYKVSGLVRRVAALDQNTRLERISGIQKDVTLIPCDISNYGSVLGAFQKIMPDEVYHLAAQSFVKDSFDDPHQTYAINFGGTINILEAIRNLKPDTKFYFAGTSEMFGRVLESPQTEMTPFNPRSPYGISKLAGFFATKNYREAFNIFACSGILFNHESPRRGGEFVTQKIVTGLQAIVEGKQDVLELGNIDAKRDWGFAGDYVQGMWLMLQQPKPDDYILATGETHSIKEFVEKAAPHFGYNIEWKGANINEIGVDKDTGRTIVRINPEFYRPAEVDLLLGCPMKAREKLKWKPEVSFDQLVDMMASAIKNRNQKV